MLLRPIVLTAVLAWMLVLPPAQAFESVPPGSSVHDDITSVVESAGWPNAASEALQQAVREPDFNETELDPDADDITNLDATEDYRHAHHCDRMPGESDAQAFQHTVMYIQQQRLEAMNASHVGDPDGAIVALGRALHALQDCYSHSNIVDIPDQAMAYEDSLLHGGSAVSGLRLASFEPGADEPDDPEGDDYTHKDTNKDGPDSSPEAKRPAPGEDNMTKHEAAVHYARLATVAFVQEFMHELPQAERDAILQQEQEDAGLPDDTNVPLPAAPVLLAGLAAATLAWRRR